MCLTLLALPQLCQPFPLHRHCPLVLISQIPREGRGSSAGVVLWILTRFWCVTVLIRIGIWSMLREPSVCSCLGRTPWWWQSTGRSTPLLLKSQSQLRREHSHLQSWEQVLLFSVLLRGHQRKNTEHHSSVLQGQLCPLQEKYRQMKLYLHQVISSNGLCSLMISSLLCVSHAGFFYSPNFGFCKFLCA